MKISLHALLLFTLLTASLCIAEAQTVIDHATIRVRGDDSELRLLHRMIEERGGRVAVKLGDAWIIRASVGLQRQLRSDHRISRFLRRDDVQAESDDIIEQLARSSMPSDDEHPPHHHCAASESEPVDFSAVQAMMKTSRKGASTLAAAGTSDGIVGSTTVAVFFPANTGGVDPVAVQLTETLQQSILTHIAGNLAWWSDVAAAHGKTATFNIKPYLADDPVCAIPFDPTKTTSPGDMIKDSRFQDSIMAHLGYASGNRTTRMRAFLEDLRTTEGTDWAFIAWIITGANSIRSNASFNGPSTNVWYNAAKSGNTFAHEAGHIFGAFDEYYEEGTEFGRSRQSRHGAPNANFDFRNHPVVPCMMRSSMSEGICSYTAVHIGLTDSVRYTMVATDPAHATFEVSYYKPGAAQPSGLVERYQGATMFPLGSGMKARFAALATVSSNSADAYGNPVWDVSGDNSATITASTGNEAVALSYMKTGAPSSTAWEYLAPDEGPAGSQVFAIIPTGARSAAFGAFNGISIFEDDSRRYLDIPFIGSRLETEFRQGYGAAIGDDGTLYFGTHNSEILLWKNDTVTGQYTYPWPGLDVRAVAPADDGSFWAGADSGLVRFVGRSIQTYRTDNSGINSNMVLSLLDDGPLRLWVGLGKGGRTGGGSGLQLYNPIDNTWTDYSAQLPDLYVQSIRRLNGDTIGIATGNGFAIYDGISFTSYTSQPHRNVKDIAMDSQGNIIVATQAGLGRRLKDGTWETYTTANSELPDNFCYSVARGPDGKLWVGTANGTAVILTFNDQVTPASSPITAGDESGYHIFAPLPNPVGSQARFGFIAPRTGHVRAGIIDLLGRERALLMDGIVETGEKQIDFITEGLESGIYFLQLQTVEGVVTRQFVVSR